MVLRARLELARPYGREIFLPTMAFATSKTAWGLDFLFIILSKESLDVCRQVSTRSPSIDGASLGIAMNVLRRFPRI